jgi:hypothetical protein
MQHPGNSWRPRVGDNVSIKDSGLGGVVTRIEGDHYILDVYGQAASSASGALRNASDALNARTDYVLDEIEPAP